MKQPKQNASTSFLETNDSVVGYAGDCVLWDWNSMTEKEQQSCCKKNNDLGNNIVTDISELRGVTGRKHIYTGKYTHPEVLGEGVHVTNPSSPSTLFLWIAIIACSLSLPKREKSKPNKELQSLSVIDAFYGCFIRITKKREGEGNW